MNEFIIHLKNGHVYKIDPEEIPEIIKAKREGRYAILRQAIINPQYVMCIGLDKQRMVEGQPLDDLFKGLDLSK